MKHIKSINHEQTKSVQHIKENVNQDFC